MRIKIVVNSHSRSMLCSVCLCVVHVFDSSLRTTYENYYVRLTFFFFIVPYVLGTRLGSGAASGCSRTSSRLSLLFAFDKSHRKNIWKALCFARCLALRRATRFGNPLCCGQRVIEKDIDFQPFDCARQIARKKTAQRLCFESFSICSHQERDCGCIIFENSDNLLPTSF